MKVFFVLLGLLMIGVGIAMIVGGIAVGDAALFGLVFGGVSLIGVGVVMFLIARFMGKLKSGSDLGSGVAPGGGPALHGQGVVTEVRDTGITINTAAVFEVDLQVQLAGEPPYQATCREMVGRASFGVLQPGVAVGVYVDPADRSRVAIARGGPAQAGLTPSTGAMAASGTLVTSAGTVAVPGMTGAAQVTGHSSSADIVARGTKAEAVVLSVSHTGMTLEQMAPHLVQDHWQADDPMVVMTLKVEPAGAPPYTAQGVYRVADGKAHALVVGNRVPVAFLPEDPVNLTAVDWEAIPSKF